MARRDNEKARIRARLRAVLGPSLPEAMAQGDVTRDDVAMHLWALLSIGMERTEAIVAASLFVEAFR